jgi:hypothetical protein
MGGCGHTTAIDEGKCKCITGATRIRFTAQHHFVALVVFLVLVSSSIKGMTLGNSNILLNGNNAVIHKSLQTFGDFPTNSLMKQGVIAAKLHEGRLGCQSRAFDN